MRGRPWRRRGCAKSGAAQESKVAALPRGGRAGGPPGLGVWGGTVGLFYVGRLPQHVCICVWLSCMTYLNTYKHVHM